MFINKSLFEIRYLFVSNGHERKRFLTYRYLQLLTNVSHYLSLAMTVFQKEKEKSNQRTSYHIIIRLIHYHRSRILKFQLLIDRIIFLLQLLNIYISFLTFSWIHKILIIEHSANLRFEARNNRTVQILTRVLNKPIGPSSIFWPIHCKR